MAVGAGVYVDVGDPGVLEGVIASAVPNAAWFCATRVSAADLRLGSPSPRVGAYTGVLDSTAQVGACVPGIMVRSIVATGGAVLVAWGVIWAVAVEPAVVLAIAATTCVGTWGTEGADASGVAPHATSVRPSTTANDTMRIWIRT